MARGPKAIAIHLSEDERAELERISITTTSSPGSRLSPSPSRLRTSLAGSEASSRTGNRSDPTIYFDPLCAISLLLLVRFWLSATERQWGHDSHALPPNGKGVLQMHGSIMLLLVEDELLIRMNLEEELAEAGFDLAVTTNGREAMAELGTNPARFCAVVTDIRLGRGPDGWEVARRAREAVPSIPVLYISGDSAHEWGVRGVPNSVMVAKPFHSAEVIDALSTLLAQRESR
jgi:CheY-like chemotaxis protein